MILVKTVLCVVKQGASFQNATQIPKDDEFYDLRRYASDKGEPVIMS